MKTSDILSFNIPQLDTIYKISQKRKTKIYLVGGFLRDYILTRACFDFDFAVSKDAIKTAKDFSKEIKGAFVLLDEEHGCARVVKKMQNQTFTYDFADFRAKTIQSDLAHRDFTVNTLCIDIKDIHVGADFSKILSSMPSAQKDLRSKTIRTVSSKSFKEDPLRLVRAFSLQAILGFKMEAKTLSQIKKDRNLVTQAAYERIRDEFFKILHSPNAYENLKIMDKVGLLEQIIPQLRIMFKTTQGGYHHLDVWPHSLEALKELENIFTDVRHDKDVWDYLTESIAGERKRFALLKLAVLLHDIGKPQTKKEENGKMTFHGHELAGKNIVKHIALLLKLSTSERYALEDIVLWHLRPGYLSNFQSPSERAIFRYFRDTKNEAVSILLLSLADQRATRGPLTTEHDQKHHEAIVKRLVKYYFDKKKEKPFVRLISGNDLIKTLKLKPSPLFAKILREVEEYQATGKVAERKEALLLAQKIADKEVKK